MEPEEKPKLNTQRILITAGIVIFAALVVGGTTWYVMDKSAKEVQKANDESIAVLQKQIDEQKAVTTTPVTSTTPTAKLQTYTNNTANFSLNYPQGWVQSSQDRYNRKFFVTSLRSSDYAETTDAVVTSGEKLDISIETPSSLTWEQISQGGSIGTQCLTVVKRSTSTVGGANAYIFEAYFNGSTSSPCSGLSSSVGNVTVLSKNNSRVIIEYSGKDKTTLPNLDTILSSLKFN